MSDIQPYTPTSSLVPAISTSRQMARRTAQQLSAIQASIEVRSAAIAAAAELQQAKVDAVARTGALAMQNVALLSQMQQQLALAAPAASGDLDYLRATTTMALASIVTDTMRQVSR